MVRVRRAHRALPVGALQSPAKRIHLTLTITRPMDAKLGAAQFRAVRVLHVHRRLPVVVRRCRRALPTSLTLTTMLPMGVKPGVLLFLEVHVLRVLRL